MKDFINKIIGSLDVYTKNSFSSRKLTAFTIIACVVAAHIKWLCMGDFSLIGEVFIIDYGFVAALFGMTTYSGLKSKE